MLIAQELTEGRRTALIQEAPGGRVQIAAVSGGGGAGRSSRSSLRASLAAGAKAWFLPQGWPHSVSADYGLFQAWDSVQGLSSYVRGMLSSQALLVGVGVGSLAATPAGAVLQVRAASRRTSDHGGPCVHALAHACGARTGRPVLSSGTAPHIHRCSSRSPRPSPSPLLQFFLRDLAGMLGGVLFAASQGASLDCEAKQWRLFAGEGALAVCWACPRPGPPLCRHRG